MLVLLELTLLQPFLQLELQYLNKFSKIPHWTYAAPIVKWKELESKSRFLTFLCSLLCKFWVTRSCYHPCVEHDYMSGTWGSSHVRVFEFPTISVSSSFQVFLKSKFKMSISSLPLFFFKDFQVQIQNVHFVHFNLNLPLFSGKMDILVLDIVIIGMWYRYNT